VPTSRVAWILPTAGGQGLFGELAKPEADRHAPRIEELATRARHLGRVLGRLLGDQPYFARELSIADTQLYAAVSKTLQAGGFGDAPPDLVQWHARMTQRPAVAKAREEYVHYRS
jgi:glutathione S-transferase